MLGITTDRARAWCFALLLVMHVAHGSLTTAFADPAKRTAGNVVPTLVLNAALLGTGVWAAAELRRGRSRVPAIVLAALMLIGTTISLPLLAGSLGQWRWLLVFVLDVAYWLWAVIMLTVLMDGTNPKRA